MKTLIIALMTLAPAGAAALDFGKLEISPLVSMQAAHDSNIYLTKTGVKDALINRNAFGLNLLNKMGSRLELRGGYTFELLSYTRDIGNNNAAHHLANLGVAAKLPREAVFTLEDNYAVTTDQATSALTERAERIQNTASAGLEAPLKGNFGFNLYAQSTLHNYLAAANDSLDRHELLSGLDVTYKLAPKTRLLAGYRYGDLNYREGSVSSNDSTYSNFDLGVAGNIAPKLTGVIRAGAQLRHYGKDLGAADNDVTTGGYSAQLVWKPVGGTDAALFAKRANVESLYGASRFYTSTLTDLTVARQVRKVRVGLGGSYETIAYPERTAATGKKRLDALTNLRLNAEYNVQKWLKAGAGYTYKYRASNENAFEYKDNVVSLELRGTF